MVHLRIARITVTSAVCVTHDWYLGPQSSSVHCSVCLLLLLLPQLSCVRQRFKVDRSRWLIWSRFDWRIHWEVHNRRLADGNVIEKYIRIVSRTLHEKHIEGKSNITDIENHILHTARDVSNAFSALTLLAGWQKGYPACKNWLWGTSVDLSTARCKWFAYGSDNTTVTPSPLDSRSSKIQNGLPFWCRFTRVVLEKSR